MYSPRQFRFNTRNELDPRKDFYYYAVCHVCKNASINIRKCSRCNILHYCSPEHQRQDWPAHRALCTVIKNSANNIQPPINPTNHDFEAYKMKLSTAWEIGLDRQLENFEKHMLMVKKICAICYTHDVSIVCESCWSVAYCGDGHRQEHREIHQQFCTSLKLCLVAYQQDAKRDRLNRWAEVTFDFSRETTALPETLEDWVNMIAAMNNIDLSNDPLEMVFGTEHFCYIGIILYALEISNIPRNAQRSQLIIHVISPELNKFTGWGQVLTVLSHWIYNLRKIDIYIVNRFVQSDEETEYTFPQCNQCKRKRFKGRVTFIKENYTAHVDIPHPDLILLFNWPLSLVGPLECSCTVPQLAEKLRAPIVLTGQSNKHVETETAKFFSPQFRYYVRPTENRYRTTRPRRNFTLGEPPIIYRHNSIAIVAKR